MIQWVGGMCLCSPSGLTRVAAVEGPRGPHPPFWHAVMACAWAPRVLSLFSRLGQLLHMVVSEQWTTEAKVEATVCLKAYLASGVEWSHFHHILLAKASHKASPYSRVGEWAPPLMGRAAKSHCKGGTDTERLIHWERFQERPRIPCNYEKSLFFISCIITFPHR